MCECGRPKIGYPGNVEKDTKGGPCFRSEDKRRRGSFGLCRRGACLISDLATVFGEDVVTQEPCCGFALPRLTVQ